MMRKLLLVAMLAALTLVLLACGGGTEPEAAPEREEITVVETVVVEVTREVEGETVVETVVEEREVVVTATPTDEELAAQEEAAASEGRVTLRQHWGSEPPTLDPAIATDSTSVWTIRQMFMGLTDFDESAQVIPGLATDWSVSDDGLVYTFNLRDDVPWVYLNPTTGEFEEQGPVTAHDVVYGIQRTLDPATASDYAYVLYSIAGAEEFNTADIDTLSEEEVAAIRDAVGVRAVDDYTVEITTVEPVAYLPSVAGLWVAYPQPQATIEQYGEQWTEAGLIVTNGPYSLEQWNHNANMRLVKNPLWPDADNVQIEVIEGPIIQEASTAMSLYEANGLDYLGGPGNGPPLADMDRIQADPDLSEELFIAPQLCTYYYAFMTTKPPFDNPLVRRAFATAIDRQGLVDNVLKGGQIPAHSFVPPGVFGNVADDMDVAGYLVQDDYAAQVEQARAWLEEAGFPNGAGIDFILMHNTSEAHAQIAQAVQSMWQEAFPEANVTIENQEWGVFLSTVAPDAPDEDKPEVFRLGWCADYPDANNWLNDVFNSGSGNNRPKYNNPDYDALVEQAAVESDPAVREELYKQAEMLLIDQDMVIAPIYYYTFVRMHKPWLTNVVIGPVGGDPIKDWTIDVEAQRAATGE